MDPNNDDALVVPKYVGCSSVYGTYWQIAVYGYKGLILIIGTFIAWETRKVTIPGLNDSKTICVCVYNITVLSAFAVPLSLILTHEQYAVRYGLLSVLVIFCTTLTLMLIFVPKVGDGSIFCDVIICSRDAIFLDHEISFIVTSIF
jgi:gamma-aminobutyric acid type B receptor